MADEEKENASEDNFGYMEQLARAYREALTKRLTGRPPLSDEKKGLLAAMQREIKGIAWRVYQAEKREERRELSLMVTESAEECLHLLEEEGEDGAELRPVALLPRAVLLANRCLNLLIRHARETSPLTTLVMSELSALYALAAIN